MTTQQPRPEDPREHNQDPPYPHPEQQVVYPPSPYGPPVAPFAAGPPPPAPGNHSKAWRYGIGGAAVLAACALAFVGGTMLGHGNVTNLARQPISGAGSPRTGTSTQNPDGNFPFGGNGGNGGTGGTGGTSSGTLPTASSAQQVGIVDVDTTLAYQDAEAAGTGMVLNSDGEVLTNNHVIDGATSITVTVIATGKTYTAKVVGTDPTEDIAVLKLANASGLAIAKVGDAGSVQVGAAVTGVGNAEGAGGAATAAAGKIIALNQTITASDKGGGNAETLSDVIVSDAPIQPGDSGGPLYDSNNHIVGVDAAANTSGATQSFAIPIDHALTIAGEIENGVPSSTIHIGYPGFLGVSIGNSQTGTGAPVVGTVQGGAAAAAGIVAGDTITKVNGTAVTTPASLETVMSGLRPGARVTVGYLDAAGTAHTATLTLTTGPAD